VSGAPIKTGTNQFPKPPINIGITIRNIIISPCAVTTALYICEFVLNIKPPSCPSSILINIDNVIPTNPENPPSIKYNVPICL